MVLGFNAVPKRHFPRRILLTHGAAGLMGALLLPACERRKAFSCSSVDGLSGDIVQARTKLAYTDSSTDPQKVCTNCQHFQPASESGACGSCKVVGGHIHPDGSCKLFVAKS